MQKKLIAMAVGATIAAAPFVAAQADVKLWGRFEVELVNIDGGKFDNYTQQGDANGMSRWGIDASKDLGNGLKAVGRYAFKMNPSDGDAESARDQWVGLKGGFGAVLFGRQPTPYKMYGGVKWDPYVATFMEARRSGGMSGDALGHSGFVNDVMAYASPKLGPVKFTAAYIADETPADAEANTGALNGTFTGGISGMFGPVEVIGAYTKANRSGLSDVKQGKIGARYKGNGLTAAVQWEDVDNSGSIRINGNTVPGGKVSGNILFLNLGYKFGNTLIAGNYGKTDADNNGQDIDYGAIGATYFLSKTVRAYLGWAQTKTDEKYNLYGAGMRYDF